MRLAKQHMDVGLFTNRRDEQLAFWQVAVGLKFDHIAKLGGGIQQLRHHMNGSILKVNHSRDALKPVPPSGITGLRIARSTTEGCRELVDPDGNRVLLVPKGDEGVVGIAIELHVNNRDAHDYFWRHVMQFQSPAVGIYQCGDTRIIIAGERRVERSESHYGFGWRYTTIQVFDCAAEHEGVLDRGGEEGAPPIRLGDTVRFSLVRDPDGNFIELSQRATLAGPLE